MIKLISFVLTLLLTTNACSTLNKNQSSDKQQTASTATTAKKTTNLKGLEKAYFAAGCFWCVEAIFESVEGVEEAISGYTGGTIKNPNYKQVSSGQTRHAEAVEVYFNPEVVSYQTLLDVFFGSHDATSVDRQGPDTGPQYRSGIYYANDAQKNTVEAYLKKLNSEGRYKAPIATEIAALTVFYPAEAYHQNYERLNPNNPYVQNVSIPRLKRFQAKFPELLKKGKH